MTDDRYSWPDRQSEKTQRLGPSGPIVPPGAAVSSWPGGGLEATDDTDLLRLRVEQTLGDQYELKEEVGRGGMAVVFRALSRASGTEVALKVVRGELLKDEETRRRFEREARLTHQLDHPNIVRTLAVHEIPPRGIVLAMEFVGGGTLKQRIRRDGALPPAEATRVMGEVAAALAFAHQRGIVHRDLKPENIFLDGKSGRAKLGDFGIARGTGTDSLTMTGTAIGTPAYMSPEQIDGHAVDHRSDLYSLGLIGWEMLTGTQPWAGETLYSTVYKQKHEYLRPPSQVRQGVPESCNALLLRLMQKNTAERPASAAEVLGLLDSWAKGVSERARPASSASPPTRLPLGAPAWLVHQLPAVGVLAVAVIVILAVVAANAQRLNAPLGVAGPRTESSAAEAPAASPQTDQRADALPPVVAPQPATPPREDPPSASELEDAKLAIQDRLDVADYVGAFERLRDDMPRTRPAVKRALFQSIRSACRTDQELSQQRIQCP